MKTLLKQCASVKEHQGKTFEKTSLSQPTSPYALSELRPLKSQPVLSASSKAFTSTTLTWLVRSALGSNFNSLSSQQHHSWGPPQSPTAKASSFATGVVLGPVLGLHDAAGLRCQLLGIWDTSVKQQRKHMTVMLGIFFNWNWKQQALWQQFYFFVKENSHMLLKYHNSVNFQSYSRHLNEAAQWTDSCWMCLKLADSYIILAPLI